jgi:outer membrane protein assembly factor BamD
LSIKTLISFSLLIVIILSACGSSSNIRPGDSLEVAFDKAMSFYERERFRDAARAFETVVNMSRGTEIGQEAQYLLARSYFNAGDFRIASSEFSRYAIFYPRSQRLEETAFYEALSYYRLSPRYNLDQTDTYNALERFQLFLSRFPNSDRAPESVDYIDEMREKLAKKKFRSAEQYMTLRQYRSAAIYFGLLLERFPETSYAEKALANQIRAYVVYADNSIVDRQEERYRQAIESYELYIQLFPNGLSRTLAEEYLARAEEGANRAQRHMQAMSDAQ